MLIAIISAWKTYFSTNLMQKKHSPRNLKTHKFQKKKKWYFIKQCPAILTNSISVKKGTLWTFNLIVYDCGNMQTYCRRTRLPEGQIKFGCTCINI